LLIVDTPFRRSSTLVEFREEQINACNDDQIVAMDAFVCQSSLFSRRQNLNEQNMDECEWDSDDDDVFIFEQVSTAKTKQTSNALASLISTIMNSDIRESSDMGNGCSTVHVAFCRTSRKLEVFDHSDLPVWQSTGAGSECPTLIESSSSYESFVPCHPIVKMRFFFAGPALENAAHSFDCGPEFSRVPLTSATCPSLEEGRHRAKLYRQGILLSDTVAGIGTFSL